MEKCVWTLLTCLALLCPPTIAAAAFPTDCSDDCLGDFDEAPCGALCQDVGGGGGIVCDLGEVLSDPVSTVYAFAESGTFLVFGTKGGTEFCCDNTDDFTAGRLRIDTDADDDLVCLIPTGGECDPPSDTCTFGSSSDWDETTWVLTHRGDDRVFGSDYDTDCGPFKTNYCDDIQLGMGDTDEGNHAEAGAGGDRISGIGDKGIYVLGEAGRDKISGSDGPNVLYGGYNNDVIYGGSEDDYIVLGHGDGAPVTRQWANGLDGADEIFGDTTNDKLCGDWDTDDEVDIIDGSSGTDTCTHPTEDSFTDCNTDDYYCDAPPF